MSRSHNQLREDALAIWQAGVDAVRSDRLVRECVQVAGSQLLVGDEPIDLPSIRRIAVVGAGKAGAGMAAGLEEALGEPLMKSKELAVTLENLLPGLREIIGRHQPQVMLWPNQLSSQGFLQAFFNLAALPGDHGKGTPWCSAAGKFEGGGQQYLAGLICCSAGPNSLGEITVDKPGQWLSVLRVRASS